MIAPMMVWISCAIYLANTRVEHHRMERACRTVMTLALLARWMSSYAAKLARVPALGAGKLQ
jgi:hypothetical protein